MGQKAAPTALNYDFCFAPIDGHQPTGRLVCFVQILLQKSFWDGARKFLDPLMRFMRDDVRDHIIPSKNDHGPP
jgi:hypothetical protein